ncbi:MAG: (2Fe-2S)-binding protein [Fidelibacterota bacterium]
MKFSSERGETGTDAVLVNGKLMNSSLLLIHAVKDSVVETIESFSSGLELHPLQELFIQEGAIQCGYCTPGMILAVQSLLQQNKTPSEEDVRDALAGVYCRCTGFVKPVKAVMSTINKLGKADC